MNRAVTLFLTALALGGCIRGPATLMLTPDVYIGTDVVLFENLPPELQTSQADLLYVTDRLPESESEGNVRYGYGRSHSLAFGSVVVDIGDGLSWEELVRESERRERSKRVRLGISSVTELGRFPKTPLDYVVVGYAIERDRELLAERARVNVKLRRELRKRLNSAPRKEVLLYVHGYRKPFDEAAFSLAEGWHFLGREQVPILYTWPAGHRGLFGYVYDRESGEFTLYHLKQLFQMLASMPEIKKINIIAHSRGTDVVLSTLRELFIEARATGQDPRVQFRIDNLILAAPDIDYHVARQRVHAERIGAGVGQLNIYTSESDKAIDIAERFLGSETRLGKAQADEYSEDRKRLLSALPNMHIIDVDYVRGRDRYRHAYFRKSPAASSDVVLTLRYGRKPGAEHGRPLIHQGHNFWLLTDDYMLSEDYLPTGGRSKREK